MERFMVLTTTTEQPFVTRATELLEEAGIPVMIEHVEIMDSKNRALGYRVLVPRQYTQYAMQLVDAASFAYYQQHAANQ